MAEGSVSKNYVQAFPGKIAVITYVPSINTEDFNSADQLKAKYGEDKVLHYTMPENFIAEKDVLIDTFAKMAEDKEIKALIISQAVPGMNAAVDKFKETRDDAFIIYGINHEPTAESARRANLIMMPDQAGMGRSMVNQAKKQGAKVFVHYSFPRHMAIYSLSSCHDSIKKTCEAEGLVFVDAEALDPTAKAGVSGAQKFITEDVPKFIAKYGEDTAFFSTSCQLQSALIKAVVDCHAIYPQPCCPSPYHGFPEALGIETDGKLAGLYDIINEICSIAGEKNMSDRLSTWPVSTTMLLTNAGAEYAIKWVKGGVGKTGIDNTALIECMDNYIDEVVGEECHVHMSSYSEGEVTYNNFKVVLMSYFDF